MTEEVSEDLEAPADVMQQQSRFASSEPGTVVNNAPREAVATTSRSPHRPDTSINPTVIRQRRRATRILDRDAAFFQSRGRWSVRHISRGEARWMHTSEGRQHRQALTKQFWNNWFHTLASQKTCVLMLILFLVYTAIVFLFAFVYLFVSLVGATHSIDPEDGSTTTELFCELDINNHMEALYFSLSTQASIGYGVSDYYFGGCWTPLLLVLAQVCSAITFDAVAIGLLFQRISRGHKRSKTILFSDKAAIRRVRGVPHMYIRLAELRHHHLLEATVRAYCIYHERNRVGENQVETTHYVTKPLKLVHDGQATHIMMSLPQVLVHRMDASSPLVPDQEWYDINGSRHSGVKRTFERDESMHGANNTEVDDREFVQETKTIESFLVDREAEIVLLLEGTDEFTGTAIQTRHSYTCDELAWNHRFRPCTFPFDAEGPEEVFGSPTGRRRRRRGEPPVCVVDFARFHQTLPAPIDAESCPYVS